MLLTQVDQTQDNFIDQICIEYGRDTDAKSMFLVADYLQLYAVKALISPYLQRLYAKRAFAQHLQGQKLELADTGEGDEWERNHWVSKNYEDQIKALTEEIVRVELQAATMQSNIGQMTNVIPAPSPAGRFPANSPTLIGDPNAPRWFRR